MGYYTMGEIFRRGLLVARDGRPYKTKDTVSRVLSRCNAKTKIGTTQWGQPTRLVSEAEIMRINKRHHVQGTNGGKNSKT